MWSCDQSLVTLAFLWEKLLQFYKDLTRKNNFFVGCSWFKFNNLGLIQGMASQFYTSAGKDWTKSQKFFGTNCEVSKSYRRKTGRRLTSYLAGLK